MKKYILTTVIFLYSLMAFAQQGFVATGGDASSGNGSVSYSVGQLAYSAYSNTANIIIEGLQQPINISVVPVSLLYFSAAPGANRTVNLNWSTVSEYNNDFFTIERSGDAINFSALKTVPSAGNSNTRVNYTAIDENPFDGYNYYRLMQTDKDGKTTLSQIEKIYFGESKLQVNVWPNPTKNIVHLKINESIQNGWSYQLYDLSGKLVLKNTITQNTTEINLINLSAATYILQILNDSKKIQSFKIIKTD